MVVTISLLKVVHSLVFLEGIKLYFLSLELLVSGFAVAQENKVRYVY